MVLMCVYQQKYDLFANKKLFCIDWLIAAVMALLNLCFYLKFLYLGEDLEAELLLEKIIQCMIFMGFGLALISTLINLLLGLSSPTYATNPNDILPDANG